jgi:hypothetical protein
MSFLGGYQGANYLPSIQKLLNSIGDEEINHITLARDPLPKATSFLANVISKGEFEKKLKEQNYDEAFHLFIVIDTSKGKYTVEKNENINIKRFSGFSKNTETRNVSIPSGLTLNIMLEKTKARMGTHKYFNYQALSNNCQKFIDEMLYANGLNNSELHKFILQDSSELLGNDPNYRKLVNTLTDAKTVFNRITDDGGNELLRKPYTGYNIFPK